MRLIDPMSNHSDRYLDLGAARAENKNGCASETIFSEGHNMVGLSGEFAFAELTGIWPNTKTLVSGEGGIDFTVPIRFTVDVKTARHPHYLLHKQGKEFADIFVLARYNDETRKSELVGWEWGAKLQNAPVKDFGHGVLSHYLSVSELRRMVELENRLRV